MHTLVYVLVLVAGCMLPLVVFIKLRQKERISGHLGIYIFGGITYTSACFLEVLTGGHLHWIGILAWWVGWALLWRLTIWRCNSEGKQSEATKKGGEE